MEDLASRHDEVLSDNSSFQEKREDVRTKFKLSGEAAEAKEWLAEHWNMTKKDVAEVVAEVTDHFLSKDPELRDAFVEGAQNQPGNPSRSSHLVSAATRDFLRDTARELNLSRDQVFDGALRLVRGMVRSKQNQQIENHEELLPMLEKLYEQAEEVENEVIGKVHEDDPLRLAVVDIARRLDEITTDLNREIERGEPLGSDHTFA